MKRSMKKAIAAAMAVCVFTGFFPVQTQAGNETAGRKPLVGAEVSEHGEALKEMDFYIEDGILIKYSGTDSKVTIPKGVKEIGNRAFQSNQSLTDVIIPEGVTLIESSAFYGCDKLERITLPDSLRELGREAFFQCSSLVDIRLSSNLEEIGKDAFLNTPWLRQKKEETPFVVINEFFF